jgi:curli biogenesis system outer membrane secretion channel CsgG
MKTTLILTCLLAGQSIIQAQDHAPYTIFVKPITGDQAHIQGWQPAMGEGLAEMIITELQKLNKFTVLESTALQSLKDEISLGETGYVSEQEKVDKGNFCGADFMFVGTLTRFGANLRGVDLGGFVPGSGGGLGFGQNRHEVQIDWRIVDAASRVTIGAGSACGVHNGLKFNIGVGVNGHGGRIGFHNQDFLNSALGKATVKALSNIVAQVAVVNPPKPKRLEIKERVENQKQAKLKAEQDAAQNVPGKVLAVTPMGELVITLGQDQGLQVGDHLKLYEPIETKDDKGEVVYTEEKFTGEITLCSVQKDRCKATYQGGAAVKSGWIVKR